MDVEKIASTVIVVATAITAVLTIIEKSSVIKWKPLSKMFRNKELNDKMDLMAKRQDTFYEKLNDIENVNDIREMKRLRAYILNYANEKCEQGIKMTTEQEADFDNCCIDYEELIKKHKLTNGHVMESIKMVSDYRKMELKDKYEHNKK